MLFTTLLPSWGNTYVPSLSYEITESIRSTECCKMLFVFIYLCLLMSRDVALPTVTLIMGGNLLKGNYSTNYDAFLI